MAASISTVNTPIPDTECHNCWRYRQRYDGTTVRRDDTTHVLTTKVNTAARQIQPLNANAPAFCTCHLPLTPPCLATARSSFIITLLHSIFTCCGIGYQLAPRANCSQQPRVGLACVIAVKATPQVSSFETPHSSPIYHVGPITASSWSRQLSTPTAHPRIMPTPSTSPPPIPTPLPPPDITAAAEQRLAAIRFVYIDEAVPKELLSLIHSFISQHKLSPSPHLCGQSFFIFSHHAKLEQLLDLHRRVASLAAVTLLPSSLFLNTPSVPTSPPAPVPPTRPVVLSFLSLFSQWRISCSSLSAEEKALLAHLTTALSGYYAKDFDATHTHLITNSSRSDKYAACQKRGDSCLAVQPGYLTHCYTAATLYAPTAKEVQRLLTAMRVCVTGIEAAERNSMMRVIQAEGGEYSANLTKTCTHLIAEKAEGNKYNAAKLWGLHIVNKAWLLACVKERRIVDEADWPVGDVAEQPVEKPAEEERKEAVEMDVHGNESKQQVLVNGGSSRMNGHRRSTDDGDDEDEREG